MTLFCLRRLASILWWPRSALRLRVRTGTGVGPHFVRTTPVVFPHSFRSFSAIFPHCSRGISSLLLLRSLSALIKKRPIDVMQSHPLHMHAHIAFSIIIGINHWKQFVPVWLGTWYWKWSCLGLVCETTTNYFKALSPRCAVNWNTHKLFYQNNTVVTRPKFSP